MLTGFFSDVHGDLASLRRALDLLEAADEIVFLGDVAGGRESCECIRVMQERKIKAVKGNHDMWLFEQVGLPQDCVEALSRLPLRLAGLTKRWTSCSSSKGHRRSLSDTPTNRRFTRKEAPTESC